MPHLGDASSAVRDVYYATTHGLGQTAMVTDGRYKYIYSEANATEELYDQAEDPGELVNLAADGAKAELREHMRAKLISCAREFRDDELFDGDELAKTEVDTSGFATLPVGGMGWRWY
jgi:arylsulfatase A-like enzyme